MVCRESKSVIRRHTIEQTCEHEIAPAWLAVLLVKELPVMVKPEMIKRIAPPWETATFPVNCEFVMVIEPKLTCKPAPL